MHPVLCEPFANGVGGFALWEFYVNFATTEGRTRLVQEGAGAVRRRDL